MHGRLRTAGLMVGLMLFMALVGWVLASALGWASPWVTLAAFVLIAGLFNLAMYFYSDKLVLKVHRARIMTPAEAPRMHRIVSGLVGRAGIPMPRIAVVPSPVPNAFATGRNPKNAVVAATDGLLRLLTDDELEGVLAHELGHVRNRDVLIMSVAATAAMAITLLARMFFWQSLFGGRRDVPPAMIVVGIVAMILAPIAAMLIQFAISRRREYEADRSAARLTRRPEHLATALEKLESFDPRAFGRDPGQVASNPATASLFIVNPLRGGGFTRLFSTHPPTAERARRLRAMRLEV